MATHTDCETRRSFSLPGNSVNGDYARVPPARKPSRRPQGKLLQILAVLAANILGFGFGTVVGWSTAVATTVGSTYQPEIASWVVTIIIPACALGCLLWGPITIRFGPRKGLLIAGLPLLVGWILLLDTKTLWSALLGRTLCGLSMGATVVVIPLYVSEISDDSLRGRLGSLMLLSINFGILVSYSLGGFLDSVGVAIFCGAVPILFLVAVFFLCPDSPASLFSRGQEFAANETIHRLRGPGEKVADEISAIRAAEKAAEGSKPSLGDLVRGRAARRSGIISLGVLSCQQACGISPVMYYTGAIFMSAEGAMSPIASSCIVGAVQLVGSCLATSLMDKAGRRSLMLISLIIMGFSQAALGFAMMPNTPAPSWLPVVSLSVFILAYALGAGPAPFVIVSEVSAPRVKAMACSVATAYNCTLAFIITKIFPDMTVYLGAHGVFWFFAGGCVAAVLFCWFCLPETSGRSSTSIQEELAEKKNVGPDVIVKPRDVWFQF